VTPVPLQDTHRQALLFGGILEVVVQRSSLSATFMPPYEIHRAAKSDKSRPENLVIETPQDREL
jgi:hypothetical protein